MPTDIANASPIRRDETNLNLQGFFDDFKKREDAFEVTLKSKDDQIQKLQEQNSSLQRLNQTKSSLSSRERELGGNGPAQSEADGQKYYVPFLEKRLAECLEENKRYHAKYVDIREFAYTSLESLMRQLNSKKRNTV